MFTGIIEAVGRIKSIEPVGGDIRLHVDVGTLDMADVQLGDSIAVNGVCLTVTRFAEGTFSADVSPETLDCTTLGRLGTGARVNLERALRLSDRLDGHIVSGHVDGIGQLRERKTVANAIVMVYSVSESLSRYMIEKGSVAVDGTSLTINRCDKHSFEVSIIPHTAGLTTVGLKKVGDAVNIETDMIGKYVERFVLNRGAPDSQTQDPGGGIDTAFLAKSGFI